MSIVTKIKTKAAVAAVKVARRLVEDGYGIALKDETPTAAVYMPFVSARQVDITKEKSGYEVRLTVLACRKDYELYRDTIKHLLILTKGKAIYEGESEFSDPNLFFDETFISQHMAGDFQAVMAIVNGGHEFAICCPFRDFYIGTRIVQQLQTHSSVEEEQQEFLFDLIRKSQYAVGGDQRNTPLLRIAMADDKDAKPEKLTMYRQNEYGYITGAAYFALMQHNEELVVIKYDDLHKIVPTTWELIDEKQYRTTHISDQEWQAFWNRAKQYEIPK